jgi:hypothetical protein
MQNYSGVILEYVHPESNQYGGMTTVEDVVIFPNGVAEFLPDFVEQSSLYFPTNICVSQSMASDVATCMHSLIAYGMTPDNLQWLKDEGYFINGKIKFNARALAIISGTDPKIGNSGPRVFGAIEKYGLAAWSKWPFDLRERDTKINNKDNYWNGFNVPQAVIDQGKEFLKRFVVTSEWVYIDKWSEVEKKGALQAYVNAWHERNGKYYNPSPGKTNHAIEQISAELQDIFDSFSPSVKIIESLGDFHPWMLKINLRERAKTMSIKITNNTLIFTVGHGGVFGLYLDNRIIVDDVAKILAMWMMRNNGNTFGQTRTLTQEDWDKFPKTDLKNNAI